MVLLCLNLAPALLDVSDISYPVFGSGCQILRSTLTDWREHPGGEVSGNHLTPRMVRGTRDTGQRRRQWRDVDVTLEEDRTGTDGTHAVFSAQHKGYISYTNPVILKWCRLFSENSKFLFTKTVPAEISWSSSGDVLDRILLSGRWLPFQLHKLSVSMKKTERGSGGFW